MHDSLLITPITVQYSSGSTSLPQLDLGRVEMNAMCDLLVCQPLQQATRQSLDRGQLPNTL